MKRDCPGHPKTLRLRRLLNNAALRHYGASNMFVPNAGTGDLIRRRDVLGILEALWLSTTQHAPDGDLSRWDPADTAEAVDWDGPPEALIQALLDCGGAGHAGFLERLPDGRLIVHDWAEHCQDSVHLTLARAHRRFCDGSLPKLSRLGKTDRETISDWYDQHPVGASTAQPTPIEAHAPTTTAPTAPIETPAKAPTPTPKAPAPSVQTNPKRTPCARRAHATTAEAHAVRTTLPLPSPSHPITLPSHNPPIPQPQQQPDAARETAPRTDPAAAAAASQETLTAAEPQDETAGQTRYGAIVTTTPAAPVIADPGSAAPQCGPPPATPGPPLTNQYFRYQHPGGTLDSWALPVAQLDAWIAEFAGRPLDVRSALGLLRVKMATRSLRVIHGDPAEYLHGALERDAIDAERRAQARAEHPLPTARAPLYSTSAPAVLRDPDGTPLDVEDSPEPKQAPETPASVPPTQRAAIDLWEAMCERMSLDNFHRDWLRSCHIQPYSLTSEALVLVCADRKSFWTILSHSGWELSHLVETTDRLRGKLRVDVLSFTPNETTDTEQPDETEPESVPEASQL